MQNYFLHAECLHKKCFQNPSKMGLDSSKMDTSHAKFPLFISQNGSKMICKAPPSSQERPGPRIFHFWIRFQCVFEPRLVPRKTDSEIGPGEIVQNRFKSAPKQPGAPRTKNRSFLNTFSICFWTLAGAQKNWFRNQSWKNCPKSVKNRPHPGVPRSKNRLFFDTFATWFWTQADP